MCGAYRLHPYDPVASLSAPAGRGQKFIAEKSPFSALRRVASSRTQCFFPAGTLGLPPAEPRGRRVNSRHQSSSRTASKWCGRHYPCPRRCSEFLPLFLSNTCHVFASRITRETEISRSDSSKASASVWRRCENRDLRKHERVRWTKSVQTPDSTFMSFVDYNGSSIRLRATPRSARPRRSAGLRPARTRRGTPR